ncbi:MAG: hypothetical protein AB2A00_40520 [Myxococcota bacterium]
MRGFVVAVFCGLMLTGCGRELSATDYDRSCSADSDCVVIEEGDPCGCTCPNAAINGKDKARYDQDRAFVERMCNPLGPVCMADCIGGTAHCQSGSCAFRATDFGNPDAGQ